MLTRDNSIKQETKFRPHFCCNQIINQSSFTVFPGTSLEDVKRKGEEDNEPECLVEGLRRVVDRVVELHFHRIACIDSPRNRNA